MSTPAGGGYRLDITHANGSADRQPIDAQDDRSACHAATYLLDRGDTAVLHRPGGGVVAEGTSRDFARRS